MRLRIAALEQDNARLSESLAGAEALTGILSLCASCKKILRDEEWVAIEEFLKARFDVDFSHSLCPTCAPRFGFSER